MRRPRFSVFHLFAVGLAGLAYSAYGLFVGLITAAVLGAVASVFMDLS
jgi:hypothetical protein